MREKNYCQVASSGYFIFQKMSSIANKKSFPPDVQRFGSTHSVDWPSSIIQPVAAKTFQFWKLGEQMLLATYHQSIQD